MCKFRIVKEANGRRDVVAVATTLEDARRFVDNLNSIDSRLGSGRNVYSVEPGKKKKKETK